MSVRIQCCGIVVLLILIFFLGRQRRTHLTTERVFRWVIWTALVSLSLDVGSILAIRRAFGVGSALPIWAADLVCKLYLMSLPVLGMCCFLYLRSDIDYDKPQRLKKHASVSGSICAAGLLVILLLPIHYHKNSAGVVTNTDGPAVYAVYGMITICLGLILYHLVRYRHSLNRRRRQSVIVWMGLWIGAFAAQLINNSMLLAGFATAVGVLVIYLALENPEANLDKQTGLFTRGVLISYLRQMFSLRRDFSVLVILFDRAQELRRGWKSTEEVRMKLVRYLEGRDDWMVFKESSERLYLVFDTPNQAQAAKDQLMKYEQEHCRDKDSLPMKVRWLFVPSAREVGSTHELLALLKEVDSQYLFVDDQITVDAKVVAQARQARQMELLLSSAMAEDRIEVFFQPIYSISQRRVTGAEALVRIRDEEGRLVPPGLFIPVAEDNGMILRLGKMIFEHVCRFIRAHPLDGLGLTHIDVNLSVVQCACADLATDYVDIMRRYGVDPTQINLEITESASTEDKEVLLKNMDRLIDYGVTFSLDDFGTGQSNLNYIMDMPVAVAKFDREMTQAYFVNEKARHVMNAAVNMIHGMGLPIVSEGVETAEECKAIEALGIEYIQGFYFSKPLPADEFVDYVKNFTPPAA